MFAGSTAGKGKGKQGGSGSGSANGSPSEQSAVSDAWSGFSSQASASGGYRSPVASLGEQGASSTLGMAILGLGLVGVLGTGLLLVASRRRRVATVDSDSSTTTHRNRAS